ncbi:hypothetical protein KR059_003273 [Drosophila kikkawai]|nr:hypothetical protein KR059_003273 [Drosophila kikkawai]
MVNNKDNKKQKKEQKSVASSSGLVTKMRPARPKAAKPIDRKLKEVKEHKSHFDDMIGNMSTLLKPVDGTTMTKKTAPVQQTSPGKPSSPGKASSPGRASSPAKPTSPAKHQHPAPAGRHPSPARWDEPTHPQPSIGCFSDIQLNRELHSPEIQLPGSALLNEFYDQIPMPGSPIWDPLEDPMGQPLFVEAVVTPPGQYPGLEIEIESEPEVVNTWESAQVNPVLQEVLLVVPAYGLTMFIRNPDGSYDLYTGLQSSLPEVENVNIRDI